MIDSISLGFKYLWQKMWQRRKDKDITQRLQNIYNRSLSTSEFHDQK